jgi:hypothetical protein
VQLAKKYGDKADFLFIYTKEAHPEQAPLGQTYTWEDRAERARAFRQRLNLSHRILVDQEGEESTERTYGVTGNLFIVLDPHGNVVFRSSRWDSLEVFLGSYLNTGG